MMCMMLMLLMCDGLKMVKSKYQKKWGRLRRNLDFCMMSQLSLLLLRSRGLSRAVNIDIKWLPNRSMGARGLPKPV